MPKYTESGIWEDIFSLGTSFFISAKNLRSWSLSSLPIAEVDAMVFYNESVCNDLSFFLLTDSLSSLSKVWNRNLKVQLHCTRRDAESPSRFSFCNAIALSLPLTKWVMSRVTKFWYIFYVTWGGVNSHFIPQRSSIISVMWDWDSPDTKYYLKSIFALFFLTWCHWWDVEHPLHYVQLRGGQTLASWSVVTFIHLWLVSCSMCPSLIGQDACGPRTDLARCRVLTIKWAVMYKIWRRNGGTAPTFPKKQSQSMCMYYLQSTISLIP